MSYSILLVDDSATTRAMVKRTIRMTDLSIAQFHEAGDGMAAIEVLGTIQVDLVLADLNMPRMDGFAMIRSIRADQRLRHVPIIVLSAAPSAEEFAKLERVNGFIGKPFTPEAIRQAITQALEVKHV